MVRIVGDALTFIWNICDVFPRFHKEYGERGAVGAVAAAVVLNCSVWGAALEILGRNGFSALWAFPAVLAFFALEFALIRILFGTGGSSRHDWIAASAAGFSFSMAALLCIALRCHLSGNLFIWFFFLIWSIAAANVAVGLQLVFRISGLKPREAVWASALFLAEGGIVTDYLLKEFFQ
jgi:hypothetical protein